MKEAITNLRTRFDEIMDEAHLISQALQALVKLCPHTHPDGTTALKPIGHDSHKDYAKCEICNSLIEI